LFSSDDLTLTGAVRQLNQFGHEVDRLQFVAKDEVDLLNRFRQVRMSGPTFRSPDLLKIQGLWADTNS
jgi:hypothetical protein